MKRWFLLCLFPSLALAEPRIETIDRGNVVEVIAHDVTAANTNITPVRSRLELPITGPMPVIHQPSTDPTIVVTEVEHSTLSIKLSHDRPIVKSIAPLAKAIQIGADLHVLIPRSTEPTTLPEPTVPKIEPKPETKPEAKSVAPVVEPAKAAEPPPPPPAPTPVPAPATAKPQPAPAIQMATKSEGPISRFSMLVALSLAAFGCGVWMLKRRRGKGEPTSTIEVIAQRGLGAKTKVVWLAAGTREMVIAVTPQHVRMLGQWKKGESQVETRMPLPHAQVVETKHELAPNPAVAGILRLKGRTPTRPIVPQPAPELLDDDIASGDLEADALWAKEILAATRSNGIRGPR